MKDDDWIDGRFCVCGCFYSFSELLTPKTSFLAVKSTEYFLETEVNNFLHYIYFKEDFLGISLLKIWRRRRQLFKTETEQ